MSLEKIKSKYNIFSKDLSNVETLFTGSSFVNRETCIEGSVRYKGHKVLMAIYFNTSYCEFLKGHIDQVTFNKLCLMYKDYVSNVLPSKDTNSIKNIGRWVELHQPLDNRFVTRFNMDYVMNVDLPISDIIDNYINYLRVLQVIPTLTPNMNRPADSQLNLRFSAGIEVCDDSIPLDWQFNYLRKYDGINIKYFVNIHKCGNIYIMHKAYIFRGNNLTEEIIDHHIENYVRYYPDTLTFQSEVKYSYTKDTITVHKLINLSQLISEGNWDDILDSPF